MEEEKEKRRTQYERKKQRMKEDPEFAKKERERLNRYQRKFYEKNREKIKAKMRERYRRMKLEKMEKGDA